MPTDRVILVPGPDQETHTVRWIYEQFIRHGRCQSDIAHELNAQGRVTDLDRPRTPGPLAFSVGAAIDFGRPFTGRRRPATSETVYPEVGTPTSIIPEWRNNRGTSAVRRNRHSSRLLIFVRDFLPHGIIASHVCNPARADRNPREKVGGPLQNLTIST